MYAALIVPALPVAMANMAVEKQRDRAHLNETWRLLQANDPPTVAHCALGCDLPKRLSDDEQMAAYRRSIDQVVAWWGEHPEPAQLPILMKAYMYKGAVLVKTDPAQAEVYLRKAAALSVDPRMPKALSSTEFKAYVYNEPYYDELAENIQARLIELRYRGKPGRTPEPDVLKDRCQAVAAWPPAWRPANATFRLQMACKSAYSQVFGRSAPEEEPVVVDGVLDPLELTNGE